MSKTPKAPKVIKDWLKKEKEACQHVWGSRYLDHEARMWPSKLATAERQHLAEEDRIYKRIFEGDSITPGYDGVEGIERYDAERDHRQNIFDIDNVPPPHIEKILKKKQPLPPLETEEDCSSFLYTLQTERKKVPCSLKKCSKTSTWEKHNGFYCCTNCKEKYRPLLNTMFENQKLPLEKICSIVNLFNQHPPIEDYEELKKNTGVNAKTAAKYTQKLAAQRIQFLKSCSKDALENDGLRLKEWYRFVFKKK